MMSVVDALKRGECVLWATDTVYGLAALPASEGYHDIFRLKRRDEDQVLPWLIGSASWLERYGCDVPAYARRLAQLWPGGLTLVVRASDEARSLGCIAADGTVALRMPDEPVCLAALDELDMPVACTSANLHGHPAPRALDEVDPAFLALPHATDIATACKGGLSSTIVDCTGETPVILREGPISKATVFVLAS